MLRGLGGCLAVILLASGCAGDPAAEPSWVSADPSTGSSVTTGPTRAATPEALTPAQAKTRYREIVAPYNAALEEFESAAQANRPWRALLPLAAKVAEANEAHARELRAVAWPAPVRKPMAALLKEIDAAQSGWERAARAKTAGELSDAVRAAARHSGAKQAGAVRAALGLPAYSES